MGSQVITYGSMTEALCYMIAVPVIPFRLEDLGYDNISSRTSWFLFAFCTSMAVCTIVTFPIAYFLHRRPWRKGPLLMSCCLMQTALFLLMFVENYAVMILARALQGLSCTVIWSVGFALLCENVEQKHIGRQLGFAFSGMYLGQTVAPPIGGALYSALGWKAPFVFCVGVCSVELIARWIVIEQKELLRYRGFGDQAGSTGVRPDEPPIDAETSSPESTTRSISAPGQRHQEDVMLNPWNLMKALCTSPRSVAAIAIHFGTGMGEGAIEPTLTLRVHDVWDKGSDFVGLAYLAAFIPVLIASPMTGWLADKMGAEWLVNGSALLTAPFFLLMMLKASLPGFVVCFTLMGFFQGCMLAPIGKEVAEVAHQIEGLGEIHQFAALNFAWALSTAGGTICGGQLYDHVSHGWAAVCWWVNRVLTNTERRPVADEIASIKREGSASRAAWHVYRSL
ncbi:hypothetical protein I317_02328 [Kwoniella heveanensis CBS 569]|nr:hypothetical protein I317_02328 [Kwoniella heveanensis CBS 569]